MVDKGRGSDGEGNADVDVNFTVGKVVIDFGVDGDDAVVGDVVGKRVGHIDGLS